MLKLAHIWGLCHQTPLCLRRLGDTLPDPHISPISLRILCCALNYNRHFHVS